PDFFLGLDLGQANDHTALCILERADVLISDRPDPVYFKPQTERRYAIRHIEQLPLGKTYPIIARHVADVTRHPGLNGAKFLAVDATGIGTPFTDMLRNEHYSARLVPVIITGGDNRSYDKATSTYHVPRNELLTSLLVALQKGILRISKELPLAGVLLQEMASLRYKEGRIETARSTQHDDLVFAAALATWRATVKL
ncbi:MAG: hypothetical protein HY820_15360, partial [Acidobacteria bacterium]|nr:hypothetical protein [Acidobacteriota bacterium]